MNSINQWSILICLSSVACVIIELIMPPGNMLKSLKMTLGLFILVSLLTCIPNSIKKINIKRNKDHQNSINTTRFMEGIDKQFESIAENNLKIIVKDTLKNLGIKNEKIKIFMDTNENNCISIIKCKIFIPHELKPIGSNPKTSSLNTAKIKKEIEKKLNIETEVIQE